MPTKKGPPRPNGSPIFARTVQILGSDRFQYIDCAAKTVFTGLKSAEMGTYSLRYYVGT